MIASAHPLRFRRLPTAEVASRRVPVAVTLLSRLLGLALLSPGRAGEGLLIPRCRSVHTFGMRFPLDLVFLDRSRQPYRSAARFRGTGSSASGARTLCWKRRPRRPEDRLMLPQVDPGPTVVVCEDDPPTLELLCDHLVADSFEALAAPSAADALRLCHFKQPDLLLLDLNLPDAPGLDVLRVIRAAEGATGSYDPELAVIVLSGRGSDADRVRGLECGADDYVVKPFQVQEVVARMRAVLRRRDGRRAGPLRVGELVVDPVPARGPRRRRAGAAGEQGVQPPADARLEPTRVFTKAELLRDVWGFRSLGRTRTLDSHASRLRRKLDPEAGRYVVNCWGIGYRLIDAPEADDAGFDR